MEGSREIDSEASCKSCIDFCAVQYSGAPCWLDVSEIYGPCVRDSDNEVSLSVNNEIAGEVMEKAICEHQKRLAHRCEDWALLVGSAVKHSRGEQLATFCTHAESHA